MNFNIYKRTRLLSPFKAVGKQVKKTIRNLDNRETKARHKLEQRWVEYNWNTGRCTISTMDCKSQIYSALDYCDIFGQKIEILKKCQ